MDKKVEETDRPHPEYVPDLHEPAVLYLGPLDRRSREEARSDSPKTRIGALIKHAREGGWLKENPEQFSVLAKKSYHYGLIIGFKPRAGHDDVLISLLNELNQTTDYTCATRLNGEQMKEFGIKGFDPDETLLVVGDLSQIFKEIQVAFCQCFGQEASDGPLKDLKDAISGMREAADALSQDGKKTMVSM